MEENAESGVLMKGNSLEVTRSSTKIRMNGLQARSALFRSKFSFWGLASLPPTRYSSGTSLSFILRATRIMMIMEQIDPMISGSSGPMKAPMM